MTYSQKYMTDQERELLWNQLYKKHKIIMQIMYYTGLRISEVLRFNIQNINLENLTITIPKQKNKTIINELIIIPQPLIPILINYLTFYEQEIIKNNGWIFFSSRKLGNHLSMAGLEGAIRRARIISGMQDNTVYKIAKNGNKYHRITSHTHKNESIRYVYNQTNDLRKAQAQGHHSSLNSTMRYLGNPLFDVQLKRNIAKVWQ